MEKIHILLFYKFVEIKSPDRFVREHLQFCKKLGVLGKILVAKEGINGSISGTKSRVEKYKNNLKKDKRFSDIFFKEDVGTMHPFTRMAVRVKKEIIRMDKQVNLSKKGKYVNSEQFLELYDKKDKNLIILDARNDYESKVGKFKGAITPNIKTFREFPDYVKKNIKKLKGKKIVTYCTGGIRCEKASAYLVEQGCKEVYQLEGGILTFCKERPDTVWQGKCFVFDKRLVTPVNKKDETLTDCEICSIKCDLYRNCKNNDCDRYVIMCLNCEKKMNGCCSGKCLKEFRQGCLIKSLKNQGKKQLVVNN